MRPWKAAASSSGTMGELKSCCGWGSGKDGPLFTETIHLPTSSVTLLLRLPHFLFPALITLAVICVPKQKPPPPRKHCINHCRSLTLRVAAHVSARREQSTIKICFIFTLQEHTCCLFTLNERSQWNELWLISSGRRRLYLYWPAIRGSRRYQGPHTQLCHLVANR